MMGWVGRLHRRGRFVEGVSFGRRQRLILELAPEIELTREGVLMDRPILLPEPDHGLATELNERINEFNAKATGIDDGRLLQAELSDEEGSLVAGLTGWTWGGCGYIDVLWVREDHEEGGSAGSSSTPQRPRRMSVAAPRLSLRAIASRPLRCTGHAAMSNMVGSTTTRVGSRTSTS